MAAARVGAEAQRTRLEAEAEALWMDVAALRGEVERIRSERAEAEARRASLRDEAKRARDEKVPAADSGPTSFSAIANFLAACRSHALLGLIRVVRRRRLGAFRMRRRRRPGPGCRRSSGCVVCTPGSTGVRQRRWGCPGPRVYTVGVRPSYGMTHTLTDTRSTGHDYNGRESSRDANRRL